MELFAKIDINFKKTLWSLFMAGAQLAQGTEAIWRDNFTFQHSVPRSSWYWFNWPRKDGRLSQLLRQCSGKSECLRYLTNSIKVFCECHDRGWSKCRKKWYIPYILIFGQTDHNQHEIYSQIHHTILQQIFKNSCKLKFTPSILKTQTSR